MTLNKFEKEIREKLKAREIKPSPQAWDKVSASLDTSTKPKRFSYFRYGIAAGFIGILILSVLYFRAKEPLSREIEMMGDPVETTEAIRDKEDPMEDKKQDATVTETGERLISAGPKSNHPSKQLVQPNKSFATPVPDTSSGVTVKTDKRMIETKMEVLVADIHKMELGRQAHSAIEVDSLLRQAQEELLSNRPGGDTAVNATALLMEVEDELNESFREKLFNKLQDGFQKVRTAVADRNN